LIKIKLEYAAICVTDRYLYFCNKSEIRKKSMGKPGFIRMAEKRQERMVIGIVFNDVTLTEIQESCAELGIDGLTSGKKRK
jgi:hypothetical protein